MTPNPVVPPINTGTFRERLRRGAVKKVSDNKATIHLPLHCKEDGSGFYVFIPRDSIPFSDVRTKDAFTDEAGKMHKEAAMLTINTVPVKDASYLMSFIDEETGVRLDMPARPSFTFNIGLDFGAVSVVNAETGDAIA